MPRKKNQKILFVSHKANRSGAPFLFLSIIQEFKKTSTIPFQILLMEDGDLAKDFTSLGKTFVWKKKSPVNPSVLIYFVATFFSRVQQIFRSAYILFRVRHSSLVFFNTISNGHIQKKFLLLKSKFMCYVHEMEAAIHATTSKESLQVVKDHTHLFIACSNAVKRNLVADHCIKEHLVKVIHSPIRDVYRHKNNYTSFIQSFKSNHHIPGDAVLVGLSGANEWRKGFDWFFPLVTLYFNLFTRDNVFFVWKGFANDNLTSFYDVYNQHKFPHADRLLLLPHGSDSIETIGCFDIHLLLSREDPYPLVVLEAASFGVPTVCFAGSGGSEEFVEDDCGFCIPFGDLLTMANSLHELVVNNSLRNDMGKKAQEKIALRHSFENTIPQFIKLLENKNADD